MAAFISLESSEARIGASILPGIFLFGCKLSSRSRSYTFKVSEEDECDHTLVLNMALVDHVPGPSGAVRDFFLGVKNRELTSPRLARSPKQYSEVCLSEGAKDECNVVEVVGRNYHNEEIVVPVANLKLSCQPWLSLNDFHLQPPVTFRLCSGSGPVHLAGRHHIFRRRELLDDELSEEDEDFSEEDFSEFSDEEELTPVKPAKKKQKS